MVKATPQSDANVNIEQGLSEMLQHLEQTVSNYEQKLIPSLNASKSGQVLVDEKLHINADMNYGEGVTGASPSSSQVDPEKQRKLQDIMKRIKDDIG